MDLGVCEVGTADHDLWCAACRQLVRHTRTPNGDTETHVAYRCHRCDTPYLRNERIALGPWPLLTGTVLNVPVCVAWAPLTVETIPMRVGPPLPPTDDSSL